MTVTDIIASVAGVQQGGTAGGQVIWTSAGGATVQVGPGGVNNGQGTVTGPMAHFGGVSGSGSLTIGDGTNATLLQFNPYIGGSSQSALTIQAGSTMDIANNHFFINYGHATDPINTIFGYLQSGYAGGAWNGTGIDSSLANSKYGVGYADSADTGNPANLSTSGQIEIAYTLYGDANLDDVVNGTDFGILAANFGKQVSGWDKGDFNYDGVVNGSDFGLLAANFGQQASGASVSLPASDWAALDAFAASNGLMADVPEPASAGLLLMAGMGVLARRRRSRASCRR